MAGSTEYASGLGTLSAAMSEARRGGSEPGRMFTIKMEPAPTEIQARFEQWAALIDDFEPVFDDVVKLFRSHENRQFRTQGKITGPRWPKLSKKYAKWKAKHFPGRPILVATGALRRALVKGGSGSIGGKKGERGDDWIEVGIDPDSDVGAYAEAHQFARGPAYEGAQRKPRPPVRWDPSVWDKGIKAVGKGGTVPLGTAIAQMFQAHIVKARKQAHADVLFSDNYNFQKMRRGVLRLKTR
ncbi:hypothetical protein CMI37_07070 [Candidatus Pacearchaeota archaeon]|nr:hypothetical protein [Candidatus Pacearchaeota archaeon]